MDPYGVRSSHDRAHPCRAHRLSVAGEPQAGGLSRAAVGRIRRQARREGWKEAAAIMFGMLAFYLMFMGLAVVVER